MSGIMAIVSLDGRPVPPELPRAQLAAIAHRGEWEPRLWEGPGVALGHVNLPRTPEAEREFLPMSDRSNRYWLTWDGRLDNRDELGPKLGYDVTERAEKTDAEYVLDAFIKWGDDCVHHLLGDWAVVIWDNEARRLFCAKDPIGWRQLYYAEHDGLLAVGSEPQQFFANGWLPRVANEEYVLRHISWSTQRASDTYYSSVRTLHGGFVVVAFQAAVSERCYWQRPRRQRHAHLRPARYVEEFEALFAASLRSRLRSNRPIGVLLSGGLDSSYVAAIAARECSNLRAFTLRVPGTKHLDEVLHAREVATAASMPLTEVDTTDCWYLSGKWLPDDLFDQPHMAGASASLRAIVGRMNSEQIGVALGGEGGDEWLDGGAWNGSRFRCLADAMIHLRPLTSLRIARSHGAPLRAAAAALADDCVPGAIGRKTRKLVRQRYVSREMFVKHSVNWPRSGERDGTTVWTDQRSRLSQLELYRQITLLEVGWRDRHLFGELMVEHRSPFNDLRLVEFLHSTPQWVKRYDGRKRALLRVALERVGLASIAARSDKGFHNEQMLVGLADREVARFRRGIASVTSFDGVSEDGVRVSVTNWLARPRMNAPEIHRLASTGIWLNQIPDR
jgi:asparagine synthase (glutamine-hydrolysing)